MLFKKKIGTNLAISKNGQFCPFGLNEKIFALLIEPKMSNCSFHTVICD